MARLMKSWHASSSFFLGGAWGSSILLVSTWSRRRNVDVNSSSLALVLGTWADTYGGNAAFHSFLAASYRVHWNIRKETVGEIILLSALAISAHHGIFFVSFLHTPIFFRGFSANLSSTYLGVLGALWVFFSYPSLQRVDGRKIARIFHTMERLLRNHTMREPKL